MTVYWNRLIVAWLRGDKPDWANNWQFYPPPATGWWFHARCVCKKHCDLYRHIQARPKLNCKQTGCIGSGERFASMQSSFYWTWIITFHPWRKGPYQLLIYTLYGGRSDWNGIVVLPHLSPLQTGDLDVGRWQWFNQKAGACGEGARMVMGQIDPTLGLQHAINSCSTFIQARIICLAGSQLNICREKAAFIWYVVFREGVISCAVRSLKHLMELHDHCLRLGGEWCVENPDYCGSGGMNSYAWRYVMLQNAVMSGLFQSVPL